MSAPQDEARLLDDILRQVVCDCGNYRHHGVSWMPEGSGEGLSVAKGLVQRFVAAELASLTQQIEELKLRNASCCGDAHAQLDSVLSMVSAIGFVKEKRGMEEFWRNARAEAAERQVSELKEALRAILHSTQWQQVAKYELPESPYGKLIAEAARVLGEKPKGAK